MYSLRTVKAKEERDEEQRAAAVLSAFSNASRRTRGERLLAPALPEEATAVWVGLWSGGQRLLANALWHADRSEWPVLEPPAVGGAPFSEAWG